MAEITENTFFPAGMVPVPDPEDPLTAPFFEAAAEGRFAVQTCDDCSAAQFPPDVICHKCHSFNLGWKDLPGTGKVWSYVLVTRPPHPGLKDHVPYNASLVQMDGAEDIYYLSNVVDVPADQIKVGQPVEAIFEKQEKITLPRFKKA